jgi:uncharacterized protein
MKLRHPLKSVTGFVSTLAMLGVLGYVGVAGFFYWAQDNIVFRPDVLPESHEFKLPDVYEVKIPVEGATLSALHFKQPNAKGVVFFLHGNAGNLASWVRDTNFYRRSNFDLFMIDYRGFGKSTGHIESEAQLHADVLAAWKIIAPQYEGKKRVIFGRSLGTTLATKLSTEVNADWTVLVSPFYSLEAMRQQHYPWLPGALVRYKFRTNEWLPNVKNPVTIIHGNADTMIHISQAERLKEIAPKVELIEIPGGDHVNLHQLSSYLDALADRLIKL